MAAKRGGCRDAGVFRGAEGAHGPGLAAVMRRKKGQQVLGPRGLARAVAAQHEEQEPGRLGHPPLGAQRLPAARPAPPKRMTSTRTWPRTRPGKKAQSPARPTPETE